MKKKLKFISVCFILLLMISLASCNIFRTSPPPAQPKEYDSLYYSYSIKDSEETEDYFICSLELTIKEELAVQEIEDVYFGNGFVKFYPFKKIVINDIEYNRYSKIIFQDQYNLIKIYIDKYDYFKDQKIKKEEKYVSGPDITIKLTNDRLDLMLVIRYDYTSVPESIRDEVVD